LDGRQTEDSFRGSSFGRDPLGELPFNPHVGYFGWLVLDLHMLIPPWYQPLVVQPLPKPITKLPYKKL
jgi:hypothetical protein